MSSQEPPEPLPCVYSSLDPMFNFANVILSKGSATSRQLSEGDINANPALDIPGNACDALRRDWEERRAAGRPSLRRGLVLVWQELFVATAAFHLLEMSIQFVSPIMIQAIVEYIDSPNQNIYKGLFLALCFFLTPFLQSVLASHFICHSRRLGFRAQGATTCMVFEKVLRLSQPAAASYGPGTLLNIMQVDTFRFQMCFFHLNFLWSMPLMLIIGVTLLYLNLGVAAFVPLLVMVSMYSLNRYLVTQLMNLSRMVNKCRDSRIKVLTEVLHAVRLVKMLAWEHKIESLVSEKREVEMNKISRQKLFEVCNGLVWQGLPAVLPLLTFGTFVLLGGQLDGGLVFSSLALIDLVRIPMNLFPQALQILVQVNVGVERIQDLLLAEEMESQVMLGATGYLRFGGDELNPGASKTTADVSLVDVSFRWAAAERDTAEAAAGGAGLASGSSRSCRDLFKRSRWQRSAAAPLLDSQGTGDVEQGVALGAVERTRQPDLRVSALDIASGKFVMIVGAVGVGKSTFVSGLLNEVPQLSGRVEIKGPLAYCAQVPWIIHGSVMDNVLLGSSYEEACFQQATHACALDADLAEMRDGSKTVIGERGINLSGGQKARVGLARAAYKHRITDTYILDDPLSAVDMHVARHLMEHCLSSQKGLLRGKTRILVTHQLQFKSYVDLVVVLRGGELAACRPPGDFTSEELVSLGLQAPEAPEAESQAEAISQVACPAKPGSLPPGPPPMLRSVSNTSDMASVLPQVDSGIISWQKDAWPNPENDSNAGELDLGRAKLLLQAGRLHTLNRSRTVPVPQNLTRSISNPDDAPTLLTSSELPRPRLVRGVSSPAERVLETVGEPPSQTVRPADVELTSHESDEQPAGIAEANRAEEQCEVDEGQEDREVGALSLSIWCTYAKVMGPAMSMCLALAYIGSNITQLGSTFWLQHWSSKEDLSKAATLDYLIVYAAFSFGTLVIICSRMLLFRYTSLKTSRKLHSEALWAVLRSPMSWVDLTPTGRIINRFSQDLQKLDMELQGTTSFFTDNLVNLSLSILVIGAAVPPVLLVILPLLYFYNWTQNRFRMTARQLQRLASASKSPIFQGLDEAISGVSTIRAYALQAFFIKRNVKRCEMATRLDFSIVGCNRWLATRMKCIGTVPVAAVSLLLVLQRHVRLLSISGAMAGLVLRYTLQLTNNVEGLLQGLTNMELCLIALERLTSYAKLTSEPETDLATDARLQQWPSLGEICFEEVTMRYRNTLPTVLNGISFTIPGGTSVGVVGRTGAGKSSLLQALFRMCPLDSGVIRVDGEDIWKMGLHTLRRRLAIIPQDPVGFTGSLRFNLDPFREHDDAKVMAELEKVQLRDFVSAREEGLDYHLSAGGENLSVGQRQLVCAARAFLRHSPILILDEATASVDFQTDALIQDVLRNEMATRNLTTLTIAHRINTILGADNVLVMDRGTAAEFGPTKQLAEDASSIFHTFVDPTSKH